ncbi:hypothetical protein [Neobacillus cucumis]|uniref:hypothetical protein n=1 Tax=Neobacillus cucumis TaxID=1740721 RepID=UPI0019668744|nr:hypothetical protein [Neobacillus cucumis]MBM7656036.1 hypothetical protein [Neobacillus cucumis]
MDSSSQKSYGAVRSLAKFGQLKPEIMLKLSEVKPSSDNLSQKSYGAVRSLAKFGQIKPEIMRSCPKLSQVRTT